MPEWDQSDNETIDVGERLRAVRQLRSLTLRQVSERAGVSESFLSQLERGKASASIASLQRIAAALGTSLGDLFNADPRRAKVHRRPDRAWVGFGQGARKALLTPPPLERLEVLAGEFEPEGSTGGEPYVHGDSEELLLVISGTVRAQVDEDLFELTSGDSIVYRSSSPHRVVNVGDTVAEVVWVITPPSY